MTSNRLATKKTTKKRAKKLSKKDVNKINMITCRVDNEGLDTLKQWAYNQTDTGQISVLIRKALNEYGETHGLKGRLSSFRPAIN